MVNNFKAELIGQRDSLRKKMSDLNAQLSYAQQAVTNMTQELLRLSGALEQTEKLIAFAERSSEENNGSPEKANT
jgi:5'-3' exonuclease